MDDAFSRRVRRYQELADLAEQQAAKMQGEMRLKYMVLAEQWRKLADYAEKSDAMFRPDSMQTPPADEWRRARRGTRTTR